MAFDAFLKFDGIDGEATESKHTKWIDIQSFSWGATHVVDAVGLAKSSGKAAIQDIHVTKQTDSSSPKLALACLTGSQIKTAQIDVSQSTGDRLVWLTYKLSDVMISSYSVGGAAAGSDRPEEQLSIAFGKWEVSYKPTKKDGTLDGAIPAGYDLKANQKI